MKQLVRDLYRPALWALVVVLLVATLATISGARAASAGYTLTGYAEQPGTVSPPPVPAGVQVDLVSRASGAVYTTTVTGTGGQFVFTASGTGGTLMPGYWGVYVPAEGNVSLSGCPECAVLPADQSPQYAYENGTALTTTLYPSYVTNVTVLPYTATVSGKVLDAGVAQKGAQVKLLDPKFNGLVLAQNNTTTSGSFVLQGAPAGTWVLETELPGPTPAFNYTSVTLARNQALTLWTNISSYLVSGYSNLASNPGTHVPTGGNVTLYDPANGYIYSAATSPGGYYGVGTYPANFVSGTQPFDVILSSIGYQTSWYALNVSATANVTYQRNVLVPTLAPANSGNFTTILNFSAFNRAVGNGTVSVSTTARLGNDSVVPTLANATVGQLWGQLGLDLAHSTSFPATDLSQVYAWANSTGPFLPVQQAGLSLNGTPYISPKSAEKLTSFASTCTGSCGLNSDANITLGWSGTYPLNASVGRNSSTYTISFAFPHPSSSNDVYNYTFVLPTGYALAADTQPPTGAKLTANGPDHTWTTFTLTSLPSATALTTAQLSIVNFTSMTANVNISERNFAFSRANVLNQTHGNYTVIVGVGQNVTFSALNSTYPTGTNGTKFVWNFGDSSPLVTTTSPTTWHTYATATGATNYSGSVTVTSSGGLQNSTTFYVWVGQGPATAVLATNATARQTRVVASTTYYQVNWSTVLRLNATYSTADISPTSPVKNVISVAVFSVAGQGFKSTTITNLSRSLNANPLQNITYQFLGAGAYLSSGNVAGNRIPFLGWQYNITLTVWDGTGQSATTTVVVLVNDTQKPVPAFQIVSGATGKPVTGSGVVEGANFTAKILLNASNATDPNNGSIVNYNWKISNTANSSFVNLTANVTSVRPFPAFWLSPQQTPYTINLTVLDRAGNKAYTTQTLTVSVNATTRPILSSTNLTAPGSYTAGSSSTIYVNVTVGGGAKAVARNVTVSFYLLPPSGTGTRIYIGGSPNTVQFYTWTGGVVNSTPSWTGVVPSLGYNVTVRAEISWSPSKSGNYVLYANATASNEYAANYNSGPQTVSQSITVNPNPTTQLLEYAAIAAAVIVVIALIVILYRRRSRGGATRSTTGRGGLERAKKSSDDDEDDDDK